MVSEHASQSPPRSESADALSKVPVNHDTIQILREVMERYSDVLDDHLILDKNRQYGDSWQAEGPFLAASRMKDKIARVTKAIDSVEQTTTAEAFQDTLEMIAYGKLLMLYWAWNDLDVSGTEVEPVKHFYRDLAGELGTMRYLQSHADGPMPHQ